MINEVIKKLDELEKFKDDDGITCNCGVVNGGSVANTEPVKGCSCTVTKLEERVSMEREQRNFDLLEKVNKIFEKNNIPTLTPRKVRGGSDGADVSTYGIPCLDSLGTSGGGSHSVNEFAFLSSLKDAAKRIAVIACEL